MAETADIAVLDGEDIADVSPWEFDSVVEEAGNGVSLVSPGIHGAGKYRFSFGGANDKVYGEKDFASQAEIYSRFYIELASTHYPFYGDGTQRSWYPFFLMGTGASAVPVYLRLASSTTTHIVYSFYYYTNAGMVNFGILGDNLTLDVGHYIEVYYKLGAGTGAVELLLDGASLGSATGLTNDNITGLVGVRLGNEYSSPNPANGEYFNIDDILLSTTGPIGGYARKLSADAGAFSFTGQAADLSYLHNHDKMYARFTSRAPYVTFTSRKPSVTVTGG